jgi:hypothetical protein
MLTAKYALSGPRLVVVSCNVHFTVQKFCINITLPICVSRINFAQASEFFHNKLLPLNKNKEFTACVLPCELEALTLFGTELNVGQPVLFSVLIMTFRDIRSLLITLCNWLNLIVILDSRLFVNDVFVPLGCYATQIGG